jgi:hypothetical protein
MESGQTGGRAPHLAAVRRYPQFELAIRRLIEIDESFRDICEELGDAELALAHVGNLPVAVREARRAEWQELVDRLVGEVGAAILDWDAFARSRVIPR